jgi:hypothetical protein
MLLGGGASSNAINERARALQKRRAPQAVPTSLSSLREQVEKRSSSARVVRLAQAEYRVDTS